MTNLETLRAFSAKVMSKSLVSTLYSNHNRFFYWHIFTAGTFEYMKQTEFPELENKLFQAYGPPMVSGLLS